MKHSAFRRFLVLLTLCVMTCSSAMAAKKSETTPTPPPLVIDTQVTEPPEQIRTMLDIAYNEWSTLNGKTLKKCNKFTEWRGKGVSFGWCGGYITWCMLEAGIPMEELEYFRKNEDKSGHMAVEGVHHVKEASVGKLLRGYQIMNRTTMVPQPGFLLVYGCGYNKTVHIALVYDVQQLDDGKYRITTLEGNMSNRVKMYIHDYDMDYQVNTNEKKSTNLTPVPEDERMLEASNCVDYTVVSAKPSNGSSGKYAYYVNCFLMPWVPEETNNAAITPAPEG